MAELLILSKPEIKLITEEEKKKYQTYLADAQKALNLDPKQVEKDQAALKEAQDLQTQLRNEQVKTNKAVMDAALAAAAVPVPETKQKLAEANAINDIAAAKLNAQNAVVAELQASLKAKTGATYVDSQGKTQKITYESQDLLVNRSNAYVTELRSKMPKDVVAAGIADTTASALVEVTAKGDDTAPITAPFLDNSFISGVRHDGANIKEWNEKIGLQTNAKLRLFVMGVELSDYISSVTWSNDCGAEQLSNNASVTLQVPHDLLTLTEENLTAIDSDGKPVTTRDNLLEREIVGKWRLPAIDDFRSSEQLKLKLYEYKKSQNYYEKSTLLPRWNLTYNTVVLHSGDTCRIFAQVPWVQQDAWYPVFTGYIDNLSIVRNMTGEDVITFSVVTIAAKLAKSRVTNTRLSPSVLDLAPSSSKTRLPTETVAIGNTGTEFVDSSVIYTDLLSPSLTGSPLYNMTLPRLLRFLFFGDATIDESEAKKLALQNTDPKALQEAKSLAAQIQTQQQLVQGLRSKLKTLPIADAKERAAMEQKLSAAETQLNGLMLKGKALEVEKGKPLVVSQNGQLVLNIPSNVTDKANALTGTNWADLKYKRGWGYLQQDLFVEETFPGPYLPEPIATPITAEQVEEKQRAEKAKEAEFVAAIKKAQDATEKEVIAAKAALDAAKKALDEFNSAKGNDPKSPAYQAKKQALEKKVGEAQAKLDAAAKKQAEAKDKVLRATAGKATANTGASATPSSKATDTITKSSPVSVSNPNYRDGFGVRVDPQNKSKFEQHNGVDIAVRSVPLLAPCAGYVIEWFTNELAGQCMRFLGLDGIVHDFYHLELGSITSSIQDTLNNNNRLLVNIGEVLAKTGNSGKKTTGYHLHWGVWKPKIPITKDTPAAKIPSLVLKSNRDYSAYKGPLDWLSSQGTLTSTASGNNAIKVEDIPLPYSESDIVWDMEETYFANWHVRCLVGFANGVPPYDLNPTQATYEDTLVIPNDLDSNKKKKLDTLQSNLTSLQAQADYIQQFLNAWEEKRAAGEAVPNDIVQTQSEQLSTLKGKIDSLEIAIHSLKTSLERPDPITLPKTKTNVSSVSSAISGGIDTAEIDALECRAWAEYRYNIVKGDVTTSTSAPYPKAANTLINPYPVSWLTNEEVSFIGRNSGWLGVYSPHGRAVTVALKRPLSGWGYSNALQEPTLADISWDVSYQSRLELMSDMLKKLDYYWSVTGNGDIVVDFPHYELLTNHYGKDWGSALRFSGLTSSDTLTENFSSLKSAYVFRGGFFGGDGQINRSLEAHRLDWITMTILYKFPNVLAREGIDIEYNHWQFINDKARLQVLAGIHLRKQIANCYQYTVSSIPAVLYLIPNTPVYFSDIDAYALVRGTNFNWTMSGNTLSYNMGINLTAIRLRLSPEQIFLRDKYDTATLDLSKIADEATLKINKAYTDAYDAAIKENKSEEEAKAAASLASTNVAESIAKDKQQKQETSYTTWLKQYNVKPSTEWLKGTSNG